ncbi:MAG: long-chain fatty acid--CoA ligase [Candidatus Binataceae bacterium]|nr:long-chain fatty acid--CoA ligase [Candidatus Binataceae bacterium]
MQRITLDDITLATAFETRARHYGDRTFLKEKIDQKWREWSWREVGQAAGRLRAGLLGIGLKRGDRVAILADNSPQWVIADQAALGMGAVIVPLYTSIAAEETTHILADAGAALVAVKGPEPLRRLLAIAPSLPQLRRIVLLDSATGSPDPGASIPIETLASISAATPIRAIAGSRDDLATFIYTSGTTGPSKGAMLSHGNLIANCEGNLNALELHDRDVILSFLPIAHSFERSAGYYTVMMCGGTIAYAQGLSQIAQDLREIRPSVFLTVPRLLEVVYNRVMRSIHDAPPLRQKLFRIALAVGRRAASYRHAGKPAPPHLALAMGFFRPLVFGRIHAIFGDRIRYLIAGGAPLPVEIFEFFAAAEVPIFEGYGLTEASPVVSVNLPGRTRIGTVGRPLINVKVKTAADGELLIHAPSVMQGYHGRERDTREAIDHEGWLHTGDIARIDEQGFIAITDRKKEIIVLSGGKNVSPANLENRLQSDPLIAQACVIGDRRKHLAALIVPDFEALADQLKRDGLPGGQAEELVNQPAMRTRYQRYLRELNRTLSDHEAITAFTLIAQPFSQENSELTPTLKLRRRVVMDHYREQIEAMYRD